MYQKAAIAAVLLSIAIGAPLTIEERQTACPNVHVFGARETTASPGYGSAGTVVNLILNAHPSSSAEAITYPAAGGDSYGTSVQAGTAAVGNQVNAFHTKCPTTKLVLVGYSQVGYLMTKNGEVVADFWPGLADLRQWLLRRW